MLWIWLITPPDSGFRGAWLTADAFKKVERILLFMKAGARHSPSRMLMVSRLQYFPMLMVTMK